MQLALQTTFAATRKEPLVEMLGRVRAAIDSAGCGAPRVFFSASDNPLSSVSPVERVVKRFPSLAPLVTTSPAGVLGGGGKHVSNQPGLDQVATEVDFAILLEIARGVPRSFPFQGIVFHFSLPVFVGPVDFPAIPGLLAPGITVRDSWWVNGRQRSLSALTIVDAEPSAKKLPPLPPAVLAIIAGCGKVKKTVQAPLVLAGVGAGAAARPGLETVAPEAAAAIRAVVHDFRSRMADVLERAQLPHDLDSNAEAFSAMPDGLSAGPKKPALVQAFAPMGYDCFGESGSFTLRRRTAGNLTVDVVIDVGTWSHSTMSFLRVQGLANGIGFKATVVLPVSRHATVGAQFPIGEQARWQQIVENLAALVAELDRSFVPAVEAASGPSPDWYRPESRS